MTSDIARRQPYQTDEGLPIDRQRIVRVKVRECSRGDAALPSLRPRFPRRTALLVLLGLSGCNVMSGWRNEEDTNEKLGKLLAVPEMPDLVRQAAVAHGLTFVSVEGVAAINRLPGTGGSVPPSPLRNDLIDEMKKHEVSDPELFLERPETALVRVQAIIPPAVRRGDPIDLRVISPPQTGAVDLHGGWLMDTRLRQQQTLGGAVRKGEVLVIGTGQLLTRASSEAGEDPNLKLEGIVLGGGRIQQDRKIGLVIRPEYQHVKISAQLAEVINRRFYYYEGKNRGGIAKAKEDDFIEITVHPRYRRNVHRMLAVVGMVDAKGESKDTQQRLVDLGKRMAEPTTAAEAAMQLEALGEPAVPTLLEAVRNVDPEIRFYAAEALAYLDRTEAIEPLEKSIAEHPAFRHPGLLALEGMDSRVSLDSLRRLMDQPSVEVRYGALRSIRRRPDGKVILRPVAVAPGVDFYHIPSDAPPFIAISLVDKAEIVLFGADSPVQISDFLMGPAGLVIRPDDQEPGKLKVTRFRPGEDDRRTTVPANISGLLAGIGATGGDYGDCMSILRAAKAREFISCTVSIDPLPKAQQSYFRDELPEPTDPAALPPEDLEVKPEEAPETPWWVWWNKAEA
jgi:hypothetical protein